MVELSHHNKTYQRKLYIHVWYKEDLIKHDLKDFVRNSVEEPLNALLNKESNELVNAEKYERFVHRQGYRSGHFTINRIFIQQ